jgi:hypothetical protein
MIGSFQTLNIFCDAGMRSFYVGLLALAIAVGIAALLKIICFFWELLAVHRHLNRLRRSADQNGTIEPSPASSLEPTPSLTSRPQYSVRRLTDRIYVVCVDPSPAKNDPTPGSVGIPVRYGDYNEHPPSYEEAVLLQQLTLPPNGDAQNTQ